MASNNSKYSQEVREETAKFIIESGKSATSVGEEMGIDKNTVCRWVRDYRIKYNLPSYAEKKGISEKKPRDTSADAKKIKQLEKNLKKAEKQIKDTTRYFKVRAYKVLNGVKVYSSYSNIVSVKIK